MVCVLTVNGREVIPAETKSLTTAGKLSMKAMPKGRFHEIYQDHVCGCALRVARELLALLPVDTVLVTASVDGIDSRVGSRANLPVLSVAFDRATMDRLDFERLDPSDAMENFVHRGDAKTSRKSGEFLPIVPLTCKYEDPDRRDRANRFVVDAFNGRVDAILSRTKHDNYGTLKQEVRDAFSTVNLNGLVFHDARILPEYLDARLAELKWAVVVQELKRKEREEQRELQERNHLSGKTITA